MRSSQVFAGSIRINEDVAVIEGRDQSGCLRQQHAVAEDVAGHVADTGRREGLGLDIPVHLAEVPLDRFPGAACGDAHLLVIVAGGPAGGESVAQPEVPSFRNAVGRIGESGRALVGCNHQVGVVTVIALHALRRQDVVLAEVVGHVQKGVDEDLVAFGAFLEPGIAIAHRRQVLGHETTLGTDRDDHCVLHLLCLHQTEHFGAEVLRPVRPAQAATGNHAETKVHAFHAGAVDEDFPERTRLGQVVDLAAVDLEGKGRLGLPLLVELVEVRAQDRFNRVLEPAQDAVVVKAGDVLQIGGQFAFQPFRAEVPILFGDIRVEAQVEQFHQFGRDLRVVVERGPHVVFGEADAGLAQVSRQRADHRHVAPGKLRRQHQAVIAVVLRQPGPDCHEHAFQPGLQLIGKDDVFALRDSSVISCR